MPEPGAIVGVAPLRLDVDRADVRGVEARLVVAVGEMQRGDVLRLAAAPVRITRASLMSWLKMAQTKSIGA